MSRHELRPRDESELIIMIGWDAGLATFYARVKDPAREESGKEPMLVSTGTRYGEHPEPYSAISDVRCYADVSEELRAQLLLDREMEGARRKMPWVV